MLSKPARRDLKHNRTIEGKGYKREDGLWDIDVFLTIVKPTRLKICIVGISALESLSMTWPLD